MVWCCGAHGFVRNLLSGEDAIHCLGLGLGLGARLTVDVPPFPCASGSLGTTWVLTAGHSASAAWIPL
jgi:hypothetical protein